MFRLVFTTCLALLLLFPAQPRAETDPQTVQRLHGIFDEMLESYAESARRKGFELQRDGSIMVEPVDNRYYAVTLPALSLRYPEGDTLKIGMIAANVLPTEQDDEWKISMAIPTPVTYYNAENAPEMRIHLGGQHFAGIWNERLNNYSKFDGRYQDIRIESADPGSRVEIPAISLSADLRETQENIWSGNARYNAIGTNVIAGGQTVAAIGKIDMAIDIFDYAAVKAQDYQEKLQSLSESIESGDVADKQSPFHVMGLYNLMTNVIGDIWDGFAITVSIEDIEVTAARPSGENGPAERLELSEIAAGFSMKGFHQDSVSLRAQLDYNGLSVTPPSERYRGTVPDHMKFDVSMNRLPYRKLVDLGQQTLKKAAGDNKTMSKLAGIQALALAPQILSDAGTNLTIRDSRIGNEDYRVTLDGKATTDIQAMLGGTADIRAEISGIDKLLENFSRNLENPDLSDEQKEIIEKNMQSIEMLKRMGLQSRNEAGKFVMEYDFELTKDGRMLLNGRNLAEQTEENGP